MAKESTTTDTTPAEGTATPDDTTVNQAVETPETTNQGAEIAAAIRDGLSAAKDDNFTLQEDAGVEHRFSLVKNKDTGEVLLRENETGHLSKIQLESIEEKESSIQDQEVEDL